MVRARIYFLNHSAIPVAISNMTNPVVCQMLESAQAGDRLNIHGLGCLRIIRVIPVPVKDGIVLRLGCFLFSSEEEAIGYEQQY
jgi:hypothetical protein